MDLNFLINKAVKLHLRGRLDKAKEIYEKIIKIDQNNLIANANLGALLNAKKNYQKALYFLEKALLIKPNYVEALSNKGNSLKGLNEHKNALKLYDQALNIQPNFIDALNNKGNCLKSLDLFNEAIEIYDQILLLRPNFVDALYNQGICFYSIGNFDKAINNYNKAIEFYPEFVDAHYNLGRCFHSTGNFDKAINSYSKAIKFDPEIVDAHYNLGVIQLLKGNFHDGLKNYEWRKRRDAFKESLKLIDKNKEWDGNESLKNKKIFIYKEQGLGDYIQFCRYFKKLNDLGAKIILNTPKPLIPLISNMKVDVKILDGNEVSQYDYCSSIVSLPLVFNTDLNSIPKEIPYLFTPEVSKKKWNKKLGTKKIKKIGLKWTGNKNYHDDEYRSTNLNKLINLFDISVDFHSLEIEYSNDDENLLKNIKNLYCHKNEIIGFDNTAGLIETMDLIITADTSIAHLSGALGKKVWIMLPFFSDYRWLLKTENSPWYPTAKLYRQNKKDDWESIISKIKEDLSLIQ